MTSEEFQSLKLFADDESSLLGPSPSEKPPTTGPKTIGGKLIGSIHEIFSPEARLGSADKEKRHEKHDLLAEVSADTIAILPGMRMAYAGLARSIILHRPDEDTENNILGAAMNFSEGVALNKISKLATTGSFFGRGLSREVIGHMSIGAGFGTTKALFRGDTYFNSEGELSALSTLKNVSNAAAMGGSINIPAGMLGLRVSQAALGTSLRAGLGERFALTSSGASSGYFAGGLSGGLDAFVHNKNWSEILDTAHEGSLIGLVSGSVVGAILKRQQTIARSRDLTESNEAATTSNADDSAPKLSRQHRIWGLDEAALAKLKIDYRDLNSPNELVLQLGAFSNKPDYVSIPSKEAYSLVGKFRDYHDFVARGTRTVLENMRVYNYRNIELMIPETYARALDHVAELRDIASGLKTDRAGGLEQARRVAEAKQALSEHPLADRAHHAELLHFILEAPDLGLVKRVVVYPGSNPEDAWLRQIYKPDFSSAATASNDGVISFWAATQSRHNRNFAKHEWGHLLRWQTPNERKSFDLAAGLEKDGFHISEYAKRNLDENWAEHTAALLEKDYDNFLSTAHHAPIRSIFIGQALAKALANSLKSATPTNNQEIANRVAYLNQEILPLAQQKLLAILNRNDPEAAGQAARLLSEIGNRKHIEALKEIARSHENAQLRQEAFMAVLEHESTRSYRSAEYGDQPHGSLESIKLDFLAEMSIRGSKSRDLALRLLAETPGQRARDYESILQLNDNGPSDLNRILGIMESAQETAVKRLAWWKAVEATGADRTAQINLAMRTLERTPGLSPEATDLLASLSDPRTKDTLLDLSKHHNRRIATRARHSVEKIEAAERQARLEERLRENSEPLSPKEIAALGSGREANHLKPLLEILAGGSEEQRLAAFKSITENYPPNYYRFEARSLSQHRPELGPKLRDLIDPTLFTLMSGKIKAREVSN